MVNWNKFKQITEEVWEDSQICEGIWGFQIQAGTKWNRGLSINEIKNLESLFGMSFPFEYKNMLMIINGFDTESININGFGSGAAYVVLCDEEEYCRDCYKYPDDFECVQEFIAELQYYIKYVKIALKDLELSEKEIKGFIPLYGHRALVVFEDLELTPVISAVGDDIVVYGESLLKYWEHEFEEYF